MAAHTTEGSNAEVERMQAGLRAWVLRATTKGARDLRDIPPPALLSLLCASAISPLIVAGAGLTGAAVVAAAAVLSSVSGGALSGVIASAVDRARAAAQHRPSSPGRLEQQVAAEIRAALEAGGPAAHALRAEIAAVLGKIDARDTVLRAAMETGNDQVRRDLLAAISLLGADFAEMGFLIEDVSRAAAQIQQSLDEQGGRLRAITSQNSWQATEIRLMREDVELILANSRDGRPDGTGGERPRWAHGCPYRGLLPFSEADADVFYGRERMITQLAVKLDSRLSPGGMVLVTGASGAGKSSLLRAGLLPALARGVTNEGSPDWPRVVIAPGTDPLAELAASLAALGGGDGDAITLRNGLAERPDQAPLVVRQAVLADTARRNGGRLPAADDAPPLLLIVDQFEQIFTLSPGPGGEAARRAFISALSAVAASQGLRHGPSAVVVVAVRGDFWDRCAAYPELAEAMQNGEFVVGAMTETELRLAITGPADAAGLRIDPALADTILADLRATEGSDTAGALPLLSQAMLRTWENREDDRLTSHGYAQAGGVSHAVQNSADKVYDALTAAQQALARDILRSMTAASRDGRLSRRPVTRAGLRAAHQDVGGAGIDTVLEAFAAERLIVLDQGSAQIAHDALLSAWPRLRGWLEDDKASWIMYSQLADDAVAWRDGHDDPSFLYRGTQLAALRQATSTWQASPARYPALTGPQHEFLDASGQASARAARRRQILAASLVILLIGAVTSAGIAVSAARHANQQRHDAVAAKLDAVSEQLAGQSEEIDVTDPVTAAQLAAAAWRIAPTAQATESMLEVLAQPERAMLSRDGNQAADNDAVAFSPNGKLLAVADANGAQLWNVTTHQQAGTPMKPATGGVYGVAFSPGGKILATMGNDATVRFWDVASHSQMGAAITVSPGGGTEDMAFSPSGRLLATAGSGGARLWNVATHSRAGRPYPDGLTGPWAVAFSPNGKLLAVSTNASPVRLWHVAAHSPAGRPIRASPNGVYGLDFSPDGKTLATAEGNGTAQLWNVATHRKTGRPLTAYGSSTGDPVAFSPDGRTLATGGADGTVLLSDVATHQQTGQPLPASGSQTGDNAVNAIVFSPDGQALATEGADGSIRLWNVAIYRHLGAPISAGGKAGINSLAFSPNGKLLATADGDGTVRLLNVAARRQITRLGRAAAVGADGAVFSPSGKILAAATGHGTTISLWNVADGHRIGPPAIAAANGVDAPAFSPDGQTLVTVNGINAIQMWDAATRQPKSPPISFGSQYVSAVTFSPNGKILAISNSVGPVRFWDLATRRQVHPPMPAGAQGARDVAFSPNGRMLAIGGIDGSVRLWNVKTATQSGPELTAGSIGGSYVAFSPDGEILATATTGGTIQLWDVQTRRQIGRSIAAGASEIIGLAFSPDGNILAVAGEHGPVRLLDVAFPRDLPAAACLIAGQSLTRQAWNTVITTEPYQKVCP